MISARMGYYHGTDDPVYGTFEQRTTNYQWSEVLYASQAFKLIFVNAFGYFRSLEQITAGNSSGASSVMQSRFLGHKGRKKISEKSTSDEDNNGLKALVKPSTEIAQKCDKITLALRFATDQTRINDVAPPFQLLNAQPRLSQRVPRQQHVLHGK